MSYYTDKIIGSIPLFQALNTVTATYSYSVYCQLRTAIIQKNCNIEDRFPFPISFDPEIFHILTIDNYDQNFPSGPREAFHSLGTMLNVPKPSIKTPSSMTIDTFPIQPTAPHHSVDDQRTIRPTQITVPRIDPVEYPSRKGKPSLILDTQLEDLLISEECELKIQKHNEMTMMLVCVKEHCCESKPSLKMILKDMGVKPEEKSLFFHLRMLHEVSLTFCEYFFICQTLSVQDPSSLTTVRHLLDELKEHYIEKYGIKKVIVAADGKLFDHLVTLFTSYGDKYKNFLPYLGM